MEYLNPIFNEQKVTENNKKAYTVKNTKPRKTRNDKTHNIKFPITNIEKMKLQSLCRQIKRRQKEKGKEIIEQTKLNTLLLEYGLNNPILIKWDKPYRDSKQYMHTNILETSYDREIGGPFGFSVRKGISDRKTVYIVISSVLDWLEEGGHIEKIL